MNNFEEIKKRHEKKVQLPCLNDQCNARPQSSLDHLLGPCHCLGRRIRLSKSKTSALYFSNVKHKKKLINPLWKFERKNKYDPVSNAQQCAVCSVQRRQIILILFCDTVQFTVQFTMQQTAPLYALVLPRGRTGRSQVLKSDNFPSDKSSSNTWDLTVHPIGWSIDWHTFHWNSFSFWKSRYSECFLKMVWDNNADAVC